MKKHPLAIVSPLFFAGVLLILLPIFTVMTLDRLARQKEFFTQRLLEKGVSLIQTFEAGTRSGMITMQWGAHRIQAMLQETALQPEVVYIMITDKDGRILAHSDAKQVGQVFDAMPHLKPAPEMSGQVLHRVRQEIGAGEIFEVYKRFVPIRPRNMRGYMHMRGESAPPCEVPGNALEPVKESLDWSRPYMQAPGRSRMPTEHYIFAGLSMEREQRAKDKLLRETVWRGIFFFILGCVGMVALFAFQAYRSARASLTHVKAFSDNVIQNMPSGLVTVNMEEKITSLNRAARDILGRELLTPFPEMKALIREMQQSEQIVTREISLEQGVLLDITASPIMGNDGKVSGYAFLFRDLTQIRELKKQVETNQRLAAIGKLAAGVAHEIRNPLSSIKGFATYFGRRYEQNETDRETAQIMVLEVERINRSITQLLEFAKPLAVEKKQVNIQEIIAHSLRLVHQDLEKKNIQARVQIETAQETILTDGDRMNQVLLNLYINAIDALEKGGSLFVSVRDAKEKNRIDIQVRDNGTGIDDALLDQIFDPYFTGRATGTGLGLSIVHRIIENLGGTIRVESQKGQGTCFTMNLPVT